MLGRRRTRSSVEDRIRALRAEGMGMVKIGKTLGVGTSVAEGSRSTCLSGSQHSFNLTLCAFRPHGYRKLVHSILDG